jgi:hypothetical protein
MKIESSAESRIFSSLKKKNKKQKKKKEKRRIQFNKYLKINNNKLIS